MNCATCGTPFEVRRYAAKLNAASVRDIRAAHAAGASIGSLARQYHITRSGIADVIHRRTWIHVH
jgi:Mor family transcriptional regulator